MLIYNYKCPQCSNEFELVHPVEEEITTGTCDKCKTACWPKRITLRRFPKTNASGEHVAYSNALGIHPDQIPEAKRLYPDEEYTPDGRMVIRSAKHQEKMAKRHGMVVTN